MNDDGMRGWFSRVDLAAARSAPAIMHWKAHGLLEKQKRCGQPRPGGAARDFSEHCVLPCGSDFTLEKESMRDGGRIRSIIGWKLEATLTGRSLLLLRQRLPETLLNDVVGRRLGEVVALEGVMAHAADAPVQGHEERRGYQVLLLDLDCLPLHLHDFDRTENRQCATLRG